MKKNEVLCKVILLGETNVGKTNIISRIMSKPFNFSYETTLASTTNYYSTEFTFGGTTYQTELKIWDTSGKQKYRRSNVGIKEMFDDIAFRFTHSFYYNIV